MVCCGGSSEIASPEGRSRGKYADNLQENPNILFFSANGEDSRAIQFWIESWILRALCRQASGYGRGGR